jgi:hypothetical protein
MTELQQALMDRIHAVLQTRSEGPTTAEIQQDFRYRHEGGIQRALEGLAAAGHLTHLKGRWQLKAPDVQLHFPLGSDDARRPGPPPR